MVSFHSAAWWVSRAVAGHAFTSHWSAVGNSGPCGCSRCWGRRRFCGLPCTSPPRTATTAADIDHQPPAGNAGETGWCLTRAVRRDTHNVFLCALLDVAAAVPLGPMKRAPVSGIPPVHIKAPCRGPAIVSVGVARQLIVPAVLHLVPFNACTFGSLFSCTQRWTAKRFICLVL